MVAESMLPPVIAVIQADIAQFMEGMDSVQEALAGLAEGSAPLDDLSASLASVGATAEKVAASLDSSSTLAADSFKVILDAAVELGEGVQEPMAAVTTAVRGVASAMRALTKAATGMDESGSAAMEGVATSAKEMASGIEESVTAAKASVAGLSEEFGTAAAAAQTAAAEMTTAAAEGTEAAEGSGAAAAASASESSEAMGETAGALSKYLLGLAATGVGVFEAIKGATTFNSTLSTLNTQAGVSKNQLQSLGNGVLALAGQVGQSPDSLAEALYHVESSFASTGITGANALNLLKIASEGATVGHANLVDVTNALDAAVASGIPGVQNYSQAMGALNAIVGSGDMEMQDLADAMGTGMLATVKGYGLSLTDVGAALAVFGDNNIRGAQAGTELRMAVQAIAQPVSTAGATLKQLGLSSTSLATTMEKGGLLPALKELIQHMQNAGITAQQQGQIITDVFGKKAGTGLNILVDQMGRLESKYPAITKGATDFQGAWKTTTQQVSTQYDQLKSGLESLGISIGQKLLPPLTKFLGWIRDGVTWITEHKQAVDVLASILGGVLVAAIVAVGIALASIEFNPVILAVTAIAAAVIYAYTHFKPFREVVDDVAKVLKTVLLGALHLAEAAIKELISWFTAHKQDFVKAWQDLSKDVHTVVTWIDDNVIKWIQARISDLTSWWSAHSQEISEVWSAIWSIMGTTIQVAWDGIIHPVLTVLMAVWTVVWGVVKDVLEITWNVIKDVITTVMHLILNIIGVALDLLTGHWGQAWTDVKKLVSQGISDVAHLFEQFASGAIHLLEDAGGNIIQGLINGIEGAIGGIGSVMGDITSEIKHFLPWSPAKKGPLSGSGAPQIGGRNIVKQIASGMMLGTADISAAMAHIAATASGQLNIHTPALAMAGVGVHGPAAAGGMQVTNNITIQGTVVSARQLRDEVQTLMLQLGMRNSQTYQAYKR